MQAEAILLYKINHQHQFPARANVGLFCQTLQVSWLTLFCILSAQWWQHTQSMTMSTVTDTRCLLWLYLSREPSAPAGTSCRTIVAVHKTLMKNAMRCRKSTAKVNARYFFYVRANTLAFWYTFMCYNKFLREQAWINNNFWSNQKEKWTKCLLLKDDIFTARWSMKQPAIYFSSRWHEYPCQQRLV